MVSVLKVKGMSCQHCVMSVKKALNQLDGVYYCDIRPNMKTKPIISDQIKTFDSLLLDDIWKFL